MPELWELVVFFFIGVGVSLFYGSAFLFGQARGRNIGYLEGVADQTDACRVAKEQARRAEEGPNGRTRDA